MLAAARQVREVPVVVLTVRSQVEDRIDGLRRGADDYVTKPIDEIWSVAGPVRT